MEHFTNITSDYLGVVCGPRSIPFECSESSLNFETEGAAVSPSSEKVGYALKGSGFVGELPGKRTHFVVSDFLDFCPQVNMRDGVL